MTTVNALGEQHDTIERLVRDLIREVDPCGVSTRQFLQERFDRGLAWIHFPQGLGGQGLDQALQGVVEDMCAEAGATAPADAVPVGYGMVGPILVQYGTHDQVTRFLRPAFTGEELWCQLFSEPGAGSDLAAVRTRATRDGETWYVDGQKVWTSMAHKAKFGLLLARTADTTRKRDGLTMFMIDMASPGVEVRPLYQITGTAEFNEVFLSEAQIPDEYRIGEVNGGWALAKYTLSSERTMLGSTDAFGPQALLQTLIRTWRSRAGSAAHDMAAGHKVAITSLWTRCAVMELLQRRLEDCPSVIPDAGPVLKIVSAELVRDAAEEALDLLGPKGMLYPSGYRFESTEKSMDFENEQQFFLRSRARTIGGGTSEVLRNVVGERVLGLPR